MRATGSLPKKEPAKDSDAAVLDEFLTVFRTEHREIRDTLLALYAAFEKRRKKRAATLLEKLDALSGPHFRFEEEALYPSLVPIYGKAYIEHMFREHDRAIVDAVHIGSVLSERRLDDQGANRGMRLVRRILPHVSDCEGLGIMVEIIPEDDVAGILAARERAHKEDLGLLDWARDVRPRSFEDTYRRDLHATMRQATGNI